MTWLAFLLSWLLAAPAEPPAPAEGVPLDTIIESLVRDLGAERYDVRERATAALRRLGAPAQAALERAAGSDDPEIRVRARQVLADVRLGIGPDWPPDLVLLVRHYDRLDENERYEALNRLTSALGPKAVPFLLLRLAEASSRESNYLYNTFMRLNSDEAWRQVLAALKEPKNEQQARLLARARAQCGQPLDALELLARTEIKDDTRDKAIEAGVQDILGQLRERKPADAAATAEKFAKVAPADARFLYLRAEALVALDKDADAAALRKEALAFNPAAEAPHYAAAELLGSLGRRRLAAAEWDRILAIPPADSVYDINAHLRLSTLAAASGLFERAAESLQKALELYLKAKQAGEGMGIVGGTVEAIQAEINRLRNKASQYPAPPGAAIEDDLPEDQLKALIRVTVKDDKLAELQQALVGAAQLSVAMQPADLRLFDVLPAALRYDKEKKLLGVFLHDAPACKPVPFDPKAKSVPVAVHCGDAVYLFTLDTETGQAEKKARYEKDYTVALRPGTKIAAWTDVAVRVNGQPQEWAKLLDGLPFDRLPDKLDLVLEGTTPSGRRATSRLQLPLAEPPLPLPATPK